MGRRHTGRLQFLRAERTGHLRNLSPWRRGLPRSRNDWAFAQRQIGKRALHQIIRSHIRTVLRDTFGKRVPRPRSIGTALPYKTIVAGTHDLWDVAPLLDSEALLVQAQLGFQRIDAL